MPHDPAFRTYSEAATPVLPDPRDPWLLGAPRKPGLDINSLPPRTHTGGERAVPARVELAPVVILALSMLIFGVVIGFAVGRGQTVAEAGPRIVEPTQAAALPEIQEVVPVAFEEPAAPMPTVSASVIAPAPVVVSPPAEPAAAPPVEHLSVWGPFEAVPVAAPPPEAPKKKIFGKKSH